MSCVTVKRQFIQQSIQLSITLRRIAKTPKEYKRKKANGGRQKEEKGRTVSHTHSLTRFCVLLTEHKKVFILVHIAYY